MTEKFGEWQPIETFYDRPDKTGSILLFIPRKGVVVAEHIGCLHFEWRVGERRFPADEQPEYSGAAPTHWMPLPSPPHDDGGSK